MPLSEDDVREILRIIDESPLAEVRVETEGFRLHVVKDGVAGSPPVQSGAAGAEETGTEDDGLVTVDAPMLGTFYRAEGPGQEPFVEVGSQVEPETTVCIIEVMKMMNSVSAGVSGTVIEVCRQNAELVEFGVPLFRIRPA